MPERSFSKRMLVFQTANGYYINAVLAQISIVTYCGEYRFGDFFYSVWPCFVTVFGRDWLFLLPCLAEFRYRVWLVMLLFAPLAPRQKKKTADTL